MSQFPTDQIPDAVQIAVGHVNVSARDHVSASDFLEALAGRAATPSAVDAVASFLNEAEPAEIADVVASEATDFATLAHLARAALPPSHPNRLHLEELAP